MTSPTPRRAARRHPRALPALALALLPLSLPASTSPAQGAVAPGRAAGEPVTTTYRCETADAGFSYEYAGEVTLRVSLPAKASTGTTVAARRVAGAIEVPDDVADLLRDIGIDHYSARVKSSPGRLGKVRVQVEPFVVSKKAIPADGPITLRATTRTEPFTAPRKPGVYALRVPLKVEPSITLYRGKDKLGPISGTCSPTAPTTSLGSLRVTR